MLYILLKMRAISDSIFRIEADLGALKFPVEKTWHNAEIIKSNQEYDEKYLKEKKVKDE
jgi:hypothetical protein